MDLLAYRFDTTSVTVVGEHNWISEIWLFVSLLGVDSHQVEMFPDLLKKSVEVELHVAADDDCVGLLCDEVDLLHRNGVDLVVAVQGLDVLTIA